MENKIHTVIFDLDGTLSDSAILTMEALTRITPDLGLPVPSIDAIRRTTGNANPEFYYILFPEHDRDLVYKMGQLVEKEEQKIIPLLSAKLLFEGCHELLIRLKENAIRLCIASTGDNDHVYAILNATGIIGLFDTILCGQPDKTEMLREIIGDSDKKGCVMVGDMKKDYDAARVNGIVSIGACYGYCLKEISGFDFYIHTPLDLFSVFNELSPC